MDLAGLRVPDAGFGVLAALVDEPTRTMLTKALALGRKIVAPTVPGRERILLGTTSRERWARNHAQWLGSS